MAGLGHPRLYSIGKTWMRVASPGVTEKTARTCDEIARTRRPSGSAQEAHPHRPRHRLRHGQDRRPRRQGPDRALGRAHQGLRGRPDAASSPAAEARLQEYGVRAQAERSQSRQGSGGDRCRQARCQRDRRRRGPGQGGRAAKGQGRRPAARLRRNQGERSPSRSGERPNRRWRRWRRRAARSPSWRRSGRRANRRPEAMGNGRWLPI